jgi:hypothetical protein
MFRCKNDVSYTVLRQFVFYIHIFSQPFRAQWLRHVTPGFTLQTPTI